MNLRTALRIQPRDVVSLVGGGGKTSTMFRLAHELVAARLKVVTTTTTKIGTPAPEQSGCFIVAADRAQLLDQVRQALLVGRHVTVACSQYDADKFAGLPPEWIADLQALPDVHAVIVEADGSRKLPLKAPRAGEPVIPEATTIVVAVAGMSAVGAPLDEEHVCRADMVSAITQLRLGSLIRAEDVAHVLAHANGGLKNRPRSARTVALLNQADDAQRVEAARRVAEMLRVSGGFDETLIASATGEDPVRERWGRASAIIMAAGEGRRFGGAIKQLAMWHDRTLIRHIVDIVELSGADEVQVVLGANADIIRAQLGELGPRTHVRLNSTWVEGMSTSLLTGLAQTQVNPNAAIFINVDQPGIHPELIDQMVERHRRTGAQIIAPRFQNMRGNPVLWDRALFGELQTLSGDVGGREILRQHWRDINWVELNSEEELTDTDTPEEYQRLKEILNA
jgi:probable selenium-dependent hydroxylase accessory protein YqeC